MLELVVELHPIQGYVGLTLAIPVFLTAFIAVACGLLFVLGAAIGISMDSRAAYTLTIAPLVAFAVWGLQGVLRWIRRRIPLGPICSLARVAERDLPVSEVGAKARHLGLMRRNGAPVAPGWIVRSQVFDAAGGARVGSREEALSLKVPPAALKALHRALESSGESSFLIRSSFGGEDGEKQAAPGIYDSVVWSRSTGKAGLSEALREVWASYWSPGALAYRGPQTGGESTPRLAVLAQALVSHDRMGVAASADLVGGGRERHLIDATDWQGCHDLLRDEVRASQASSGQALTDDQVRQLSKLVARAEAQLGRPAEIEWGLQGARLTLYQARALTGAPPPVTVTNTHLIELPRYPLTPLSHAFLWGEGPPIETLRGGLGLLGLKGLEDSSLRLVKGRVMLDVSAFKGAILGVNGAAGLGVGPLVAALLGLSARSEPPRPSPPERPKGTPTEHARALGALRQERLLPLIHAQMRALALAALLDAWLSAACGDDGAPAPKIQRADAGEAWYRAEREAELACPRRSSRDERPRAAGEGGSSPGLMARWVAWARDRQLSAREALNVAINVVNYEARQRAIALDEALALTVPEWQAGDAFYCTPSELEALSVDPASGPSTEAREARRRQQEEHEALNLAGLCDLDHAGEPLTRASGAAEGAMGAAMGHGVLTLEACVVREGMTQPADAARERILIVDGGAAVWSRHVLEARALVLVGAGPLSHLALLARERGIPVLAAVSDPLTALQTGDRITLDLDAATVGRAG